MNDTGHYPDLNDAGHYGSDLTCPVPGCTEEIEYEPPYPADRATNVAAWAGGYLCPVHGRVRPHELVANDPEALRELTGL